MSIEQAKASLMSTAWYMSDQGRPSEERLAQAERFYRRLCDIVGFDTPENTVMRRVAAAIERELKETHPPASDSSPEGDPRRSTGESEWD